MAAQLGGLHGAVRFSTASLLLCFAVSYFCAVARASSDSDGAWQHIIVKGRLEEVKAFSDQMTFDNAEAVCRQNGANLLSLDSEAEHQDVIRVLGLQRAQIFWLGLHRNSQGEWTWTDTATTTTYRNWRQAPVADSNLDCATITTNGWIPSPCSEEVAFICERPFGEECTVPVFRDDTQLVLKPQSGASTALLAATTLEFWLRPADNMESTMVFDSQGLAVRIEDDGLYVKVQGSTHVAWFPVEFVPDAWVHIAFVLDFKGCSATLFLDGDQENADTFPQCTAWSPGSDLTVSAPAGASLYELRMWTSARSLKQVTNLYRTIFNTTNSQAHASLLVFILSLNPDGVVDKTGHYSLDQGATLDAVVLLQQCPWNNEGKSTCTPGTRLISEKDGQKPTYGENLDFEDNKVDGYKYMTPSKWASSDGGVVIVNNGNKAWGGLTSGHGANFISLQGDGNYIEQELVELTPGVAYEIKFFATHRPGYGEDERLIVMIDSVSVFESQHPGDNFLEYHVFFIAASTVATLRFENDSPVGDRSVFIDHIEIEELITTPAITNGDFEVDVITNATKTLVPTGWTTEQPFNIQVVVNSKAELFDKMTSRHGSQFVAVKVGTVFEQQLKGLDVGQTYGFEMLAASVPESPVNVKIIINDTILYSGTPQPTFTRYRNTFELEATEATIKVIVEATAKTTDNAYVLLDDLNVFPPEPELGRNFDFEADEITDPRGYSYTKPSHWAASVGRVVIVTNGNRPWGGLSSGNGDYFISIQNGGSTVSQHLRDLEPLQTYELSFLAASRPGYGTEEMLRVAVNGEPIAVQHPGESFQLYRTRFVAQQSTVLLAFENISPEQKDSSVFVDDVHVLPVAFGDCVPCLPGTYAASAEASECLPCVTACPSGQQLQGSCTLVSTPKCVDPCAAAHHGTSKSIKKVTDGKAAQIVLGLMVAVLVCIIAAMVLRRRCKSWIPWGSSSSSHYQLSSMDEDDEDLDVDSDEEGRIAGGSAGGGGLFVQQHFTQAPSPAATQAPLYSSEGGNASDDDEDDDMIDA